jgi:hypothetical protein
VLAAGLVVILVLAALGIHSCQVSQRNSALMTYTNNVTSLIDQSGSVSSNFFGVLRRARSSSNSAGAASVQSGLSAAGLVAGQQLTRARSWDVPSEMSAAQQDLVLSLQMRVDGIGNVASNIQRALANDRDAVNKIAAEMARLYASDAVYKDYVAPQISSALHAAGIAVGGSNGEQIAQQQFVEDIRWLSPAFVATELQVRYGSSGGKVASGLHGHALSSVTVGGRTLSPASTNTILASPPATFTLNFTNTGQNTETNVVCKVSVSGTSDTGQTIVPQTTAGQTTTCQVTLASAPSAGQDTVDATIEPVPGEKNSSNNTLSFPVTFQ